MRRCDVNRETQRLMQALLALEPTAVLVFRDDDPSSDSEGPIIVRMPAVSRAQCIELLQDAVRIAQQLP